jgi:hypothetical protein
VLCSWQLVARSVKCELLASKWQSASAWPALPPGYVALAEALRACWARRVSDRPSMAQVLEALLDMLAAAEQQKQGY